MREKRSLIIDISESIHYKLDLKDNISYIERRDGTPVFPEKNVLKFKIEARKISTDIEEIFALRAWLTLLPYKDAAIVLPNTYDKDSFRHDLLIECVCKKELNALVENMKKKFEVVSAKDDDLAYAVAIIVF
ncbi:MAG: hypothetical protein JXR42_01440 [Gammaproteobacteria bacterium]|nr:hypothetical protein [Gammaproteobacteria bacterium]